MGETYDYVSKVILSSKNQFLALVVFEDGCSPKFQKLKYRTSLVM